MQVNIFARDVFNLCVRVVEKITSYYVACEASPPPPPLHALLLFIVNSLVACTALRRVEACRMSRCGRLHSLLSTLLQPLLSDGDFFPLRFGCAFTQRVVAGLKFYLLWCRSTYKATWRE